MNLGFNDNGSGMAALLELARALKQSQCKNSHTYILVALDMGETGTQGATAFVQDFLIRSILRPQRFPEFQVIKYLPHFCCSFVERNQIGPYTTK